MFLPLTFMVDLTMNLISRLYYKCERSVIYEYLKITYSRPSCLWQNKTHAPLIGHIFCALSFLTRETKERRDRDFKTHWISITHQEYSMIPLFFKGMVLIVAITTHLKCFDLNHSIMNTNKRLPLKYLK